MNKKKAPRVKSLNIKALRFLTAYAIISLAILITAINNFRQKNITYVKQSPIVGSEPSTEYIYVAPDPRRPQSSVTDAGSEEIYTIREHNGKIGIFYSNGTLKEVLEVYIKSLPEADRHLLREGFEVIGEKQLNGIIEDYTG